jgi:hypothetical protein
MEVNVRRGLTQIALSREERTMPNNLDYDDGIDNEAKNWLIHEPEELRDIMADIPLFLEGSSNAIRMPLA